MDEYYIENGTWLAPYRKGAGEFPALLSGCFSAEGVPLIP